MKNRLCLMVLLVAMVAGNISGQHDFEFTRRAGPFPFLNHDETAVPTPEDPDGDGIIGVAGKDYPILRSPPSTSFTCEGKIPGIYADMETGCQVYHVCQADMRKESTLCANGTVFNQATFSCDWWHNVDCSASESFYSMNADLGKEPENAYHRTGSIHFPLGDKPLKKPPQIPLPLLPPPPLRVPDFTKRIPGPPGRPKPRLNVNIPLPPGTPRPEKTILPPNPAPQFVEDVHPGAIPRPPNPNFFDEIPSPPRVRIPGAGDLPQPRPPKPEALLRARPGDPHYGRNGAFDPALHLPRPKLDKKPTKPGQTSKNHSKSPMMLPVKSDDVIAGYSDLYLGKPVDED